MKKITSLLIFCMMVGWAFAGPVSRQQALDIAKSYLQKNRAARGAVQTSSDLTLAYECMPKAARSSGVSTPLYYVFNQKADNGFLVVSGDDRMTPVLGVVDEGSFVRSEVHPGMQWWLNAVEATMLSVVTSDENAPVFTSATDGQYKPEVAPLVKVNWGQGAPHNNRCPVDNFHGNNQRSLVGCTAVALAQVLSRWQYPAKPAGKVDYTTYTHKIHLTEDLSTFDFKWDKMLPFYGGGVGTAEEKAAIADLMYACGLAVNMDYCSLASGAFLTAADMKENFNMDGACNNVERLYFTKDEWDAMVKKELSEGRPVVYNGFSMSAGHAFVCDGYNTDGLFHINWGWDGGLNGYFALAELNSAVEHAGAPTDADGSFNIDQSMVYGIQPKVGEGNAPKLNLYFSNMEDNKTILRTKVSVKVDLLRADGNGFSGSVALGIFDKEDKFVDIVGNEKTLTLKPGNFYKDFDFTGEISRDVVDGTYSLRPVYKVGDGDFQVARGRKGSPYVDHLTLQLVSARAKITKPELFESDLKIVSVKPLDDKVYAGAKNALEITLRNDGAMYNGPLVISRRDLDKNIRVYDNNYIIEQGEEIAVRVNIEAPEGVGTDKLEVWVAKSDNDIYHNNGFEYGLVGTFEYELIIPTAGVPNIMVKRLVINNATSYLDKYLDVDINLENTGGFYGGKLICFAFPEVGGTSLCSGSRKIVMDKGDALSVNLQIPIENLGVGKYFIYPYIVLNGQYKQLTTTAYYFTVKNSGSFSITNSEGYEVFYASHSVEVPQGFDCGVVTAIGKDALMIDYRYHEGDILPAQTAAILKTEKGRGTYTYTIVRSEETAPEDNLLMHQVDEKGYTFAGEGDYWYYIFNHDGTRHNYGFYLKNEDGRAFKLRNGECYLAVPANVANPNGYAFNADVTAIEDLTVDVIDNAEIYNLSGVKVSAKWSDLPKGIYIVNGKKVVK